MVSNHIIRQIIYVLLTLTLLKKRNFSFNLHVLSIYKAFNLSQDQTLEKNKKFNTNTVILFLKNIDILIEKINRNKTGYSEYHVHRKDKKDDTNQKTRKPENTRTGHVIPVFKATILYTSIIYYLYTSSDA